MQKKVLNKGLLKYIFRGRGKVFFPHGVFHALKRTLLKRCNIHGKCKDYKWNVPNGATKYE